MNTNQSAEETHSKGPIMNSTNENKSPGKMEHAKEPWSIRPGLVIESADNKIVCDLNLAHESRKANAARTVACVNFCAGFKDLSTFKSLHQIVLNHDGLAAENHSLSSQLSAAQKKAEWVDTWHYELLSSLWDIPNQAAIQLRAILASEVKE